MYIISQSAVNCLHTIIKLHCHVESGHDMQQRHLQWFTGKMSLDKCSVVHKRMYWIQMNLRMLQPSNVFVTFECLNYAT